jgi:hypothetical protein
MRVVRFWFNAIGSSMQQIVPDVALEKTVDKTFMCYPVTGSNQAAGSMLPFSGVAT